MILDLKGKKAVVTGGSRGLGYGIAQALHDSGAEVIITGGSETVKAAAAGLETAHPGGGRKDGELSAPKGERVHGLIGDLSDREQLERIYEEIMDIFGGRIDILVNAAGTLIRCPAVDVTEKEWCQVVQLNLNALFFMTQLAGRTMITQHYGKIINIASMNSFFGSVMVPAYSASKGGVAQLTKALSNEWAGKGINVNAIAPGYMETELTKTMKSVNPAQYEETTRRIPMGRWGTAEDLKGLAVFLASDASSYLSGAVIPVDGGFLGK